MVEFLFADIELPDSNVNEPASHGFVKFKIQQKAGNSSGTRIENTAAIYFDFNAPILTNTTWHTIGSDFIISNVEMIDEENIAIETVVYPNPMSEQATIELRGLAITQTASLKIFNAVGQQVEYQESNSGRFEIQNRGWEAGMYIYQIVVDGKQLGVGKILVK